MTTSRSYDAVDELLSITHANAGLTLESMSYAYDNAGNRTSMADSSGTTSFTYDALNRLTQAAYPNGDYTNYGYDAVGNRSSSTTNGVTTTNTFDAANRMTASGATSFGYDANGNQTSQTTGGVTTTYTYDALDRLTALSGPSSATYVYNGDGLRVRKTVGGITTNDAWADVLGTAQVVADGTNEYVHGLEFISQVATGTGVATYPLGDALGSTRVGTDISGNTVGTTQYDAYGTTRAQTGQQLRLGFTGQQQDAESGLLYLRGRFYDPKTGRFLSQDSGGGGSYAYASDNPTRFTDPSGHKPVQDYVDEGDCGAEAGCSEAAYSDLLASLLEQVINSAINEATDTGEVVILLGATTIGVSVGPVQVAIPGVHTAIITVAVTKTANGTVVTMMKNQGQPENDSCPVNCGMLVTRSDPTNLQKLKDGGYSARRLGSLPNGQDLVASVISSLNGNVAYNVRGPNSNSITYYVILKVLGPDALVSTDDIRDLLTADSSRFAKATKKLLNIPGWQYYPRILGGGGGGGD